MAMYPIKTVTVAGTSTASMTFSSIPQTYQHLQLRISARMISSQTTPYDLTMTVNGANPSTFSYHSMRGDGFNCFSGGATSDNVFRFVTCVANAAHTSSMFSGHIVDIYDYTNTGKFKTAKAHSGVKSLDTSTPQNGQILIQSSLWSSTNAITSLDIGSFGNFAAGTTATLYGITSSPRDGA